MSSFRKVCEVLLAIVVVVVVIVFHYLCVYYVGDKNPFSYLVELNLFHFIASHIYIQGVTN